MNTWRQLTSNLYYNYNEKKKNQKWLIQIILFNAMQCNFKCGSSLQMFLWSLNFTSLTSISLSHYFTFLHVDMKADGNFKCAVVLAGLSGGFSWRTPATGGGSWWLASGASQQEAQHPPGANWWAPSTSLHQVHQPCGSPRKRQGQGPVSYYNIL